MKDSLKYGLMVAGMIISWTAYYTVSKVLVDATGSALLTGFLLRSAALLFLTVQLLCSGCFAGLLRQGRATRLLLLIGLLGFLLDLFANLGYAGGSLSTGTALLKTDVLMVNLVTVLLYHKRLRLVDWAGTFVMLFGVLLVLGVDLRGIEPHPTDLFFLLSAACVTANAFVIRAAEEKHGVEADVISYYNNFVVLLLFGTASSLLGELRPAMLERLAGLWPLVLLGGLAQTGIYFFYYRNLKHFEVWVVKLYLLLMPVLSCLVGVVFLREELTLRKILGILTVLLGAALILLRGKIHRPGRMERTQTGGLLP